MPVCWLMFHQFVLHVADVVAILFVADVVAIIVSCCADFVTIIHCWLILLPMSMYC